MDGLIEKEKAVEVICADMVFEEARRTSDHKKAVNYRNVIQEELERSHARSASSRTVWLGEAPSMSSCTFFVDLALRKDPKEELLRFPEEESEPGSWR